MDLDHVALGLHDVTDALFAFVGDLGAGVVDGGQSVGFRIVQIRLGRRPNPADPSDPGEGMKIELMEPWAAERFDFLARFLERNGEGPHHMTFKVDGIRDEIARLEAAGYTPVRTQLDNPWWREAFYHPKDTFGTVVQVAESTFDAALVEEHERARADGTSDFGSVEWWPTPPARAERRTTLRRVAIGVPDLGAARGFFGDVMQGHVVAERAEAVELAWPGGGRLLLEQREGSPGVDRYECEREGEPEERVIGGARIVIRPPD